MQTSDGPLSGPGLQLVSRLLYAARNIGDFGTTPAFDFSCIYPQLCVRHLPPHITTALLPTWQLNRAAIGQYDSRKWAKKYRPGAPVPNYKVTLGDDGKGMHDGVAGGDENAAPAAISESIRRLNSSLAILLMHKKTRLKKPPAPAVSFRLGRDDVYGVCRCASRNGGGRSVHVTQPSGVVWCVRCTGALLFLLLFDATAS